MGHLAGQIHGTNAGQAKYDTIIITIPITNVETIGDKNP